MSEKLIKETEEDILAGQMSRCNEILDFKKRIATQILPEFYSERQDRGIAKWEMIKEEKQNQN